MTTTLNSTSTSTANTNTNTNTIQRRPMVTPELRPHPVLRPVISLHTLFYGFGADITSTPQLRSKCHNLRGDRNTGVVLLPQLLLPLQQLHILPAQHYSTLTTIVIMFLMSSSV